MIQLFILQLGHNVVIEENNWGTIAPLPFFVSCVLLFLCAWSVVSPLLAAVAKAQQMHRIPCTQCRFFTNDHRLKCTIKPQIANTEEAIDCRDYHKLS